MTGAATCQSQNQTVNSWLKVSGPGAENTTARRLGHLVHQKLRLIFGKFLLDVAPRKPTPVFPRSSCSVIVSHGLVTRVLFIVFQEREQEVLYVETATAIKVALLFTGWSCSGAAWARSMSSDACVSSNVRATASARFEWYSAQISL